MAILTNKSDVIANFVRYHGRQPNAGELAKGGLIEYLTTKPPKEVESLLAKNSPITKGKLWDDYQKTKTINNKQDITIPTTSKINDKTGEIINPTKKEDSSDGVVGEENKVEESDFKNSPEYQALSDDMKALADTVNNALNATDEQTRLSAQEALAKAKEMVDPYSKILLSFALDSIPNDFRIKKLSIEDQIKTNQERQAEIATLMKNAPLEQQEQLDQLRRGYEDNINTLQDNVAESGLTFSTKRTDMERQIGNQNMDIMTSSKRSYEGKLKSHETAQAEAKRQADLIKASGEQSLKDMARDAESKLGTSGYNKLGLTDLSGKTIGAIGGTGETPLYGGDIEQQRQQMILNLAQQIGQYNSPEELKNLL